jgi:hypothetical protein
MWMGIVVIVRREGAGVVVSQEVRPFSARVMIENGGRGISSEMGLRGLG